MSERDTRIGELYEAALKRPIGERAAFVASRAGGDGDLRRRVEALLAGQHDTELPGYEAGTGADTLLAAGTQIGTYRIDGPLGAGGMGVVYRATDTKLQRPAAIKVLPENLADPEARRRFQREAQMVSSLNHPHIVTVYDAGEYLERQYLITEYVDGGTLRQWAGRPHGWRPIVELLIGVADGIATAHDAGILHRDIKPENILLAKNGYAKLADFGIAKLLEADPLADDALGAIRPGGESSLIGTAAYMSPEQAQGLALDARSDVYSFGLVLHELLAGTRSFGHGEPGKSASAIPPLGEEVPSELRTIVAKALEPESADRYQTMRDLVVDLRRLARRSGLESGATPSIHDSLGSTGPVVPPRRFTERRLWYVVAGLALAVLGFATREAIFNAPSAKSVAVLPFVNESAAPEDVPISEGIGDDLRDRLVALPGLRVQSRASSVSFREQNVDIPRIAATLEVGRLINGRVRRQGRTLEVVVEVLDHRGFAIRPPLRFEGAATGLQALQQDIAAQVSMLLVPDASSPPVVAATPTSASERANLLVLIGTRAERQVKESFVVDEAKLDEAIDLYRQATLADPKSVKAHARLAAMLLYNGDVEGASAPLSTAIDLGKAIDTSSAAADLSDAYLTTALFLLRTRSNGIEVAYQQAVTLNPSNVDALGAYAQWLMVHRRPREADAYFREAIRLDRRSLSRYLDYGEYLGILEDMQGVREVADDVLNRFPDARGYVALARLHEITGDLDIGIAWGLKAYREKPNDDDTRGQVGELYGRIGDFDKMRQFDPDPRMSQFLLQSRNQDLIAILQERVLEDQSDLNAQYFLAFAYNIAGSFADAKSLLERAGMPVQPDAEYNSGGAERQAVASYVDALQGLEPNDPFARKLAEEQVTDSLAAAQQSAYFAAAGQLRYSWWLNAYLACAYTQLDQRAEALDALDRVKLSQGLAWSWLIRDAPCFKPLAAEPRYRALLDYLEERQRILRERLPMTLLEHGVADVRPAGTV